MFRLPNGLKDRHTTWLVMGLAAGAFILLLLWVNGVIG